MNIQQFRDFINKSHHDFVFQKYSDVDGKNHWSCICSAMDWHTEAEEAMPEFEKRACGKKAGWIDIYGYLSCVDVIVEATEQLHRCVFSFGGNPSELQFTTKVFTAKPTEFQDLSDRAYFKELRAGFGAHPVNLRHPDGKSAKEKTRKFASWVLNSERTSSGFDFEVRVYSGMKGVADSYLGVNVSDLKRFCNQYRDHIKNIASEISRQYAVFAEECRKRPIERSGDSVKQWNILKSETKRRCLGDWDATAPEILSTRVSNPGNRKLLTTYQRTVKRLIARMVDAFQKMDDSAFQKVGEEYHHTLYPAYPQVEGLGYCLGKLLANDLPYSFVKTEIEAYFGSRIDFDSLNSDVERQVVVRAALWKEKNGRRQHRGAQHRSANP